MSSESSQKANPSESTTSSHHVEDSEQSHTSHSDEQPTSIHPRRPSQIPESELPEYITYSCIRKKSTLSGRCTHFQLSLDDRDIYHSKIKSTTQTEPIPIAAGTEAHYSKGNDFYLLTNKSHEAFSLRAKKPNGKEIAILTMYQIISIDDPKNIQLLYNRSESDDTKIKLVNRKPTLQADGTWVLDFSERYTIPSKKNAILVDDETGKEMIVVRKVEENEIELDAFEPIPPIYVFALAVAFWVCPI